MQMQPCQGRGSKWAASSIRPSAVGSFFRILLGSKGSHVEATEKQGSIPLGVIQFKFDACFCFILCHCPINSRTTVGRTTCSQVTVETSTIESRVSVNIVPGPGRLHNYVRKYQSSVLRNLVVVLFRYRTNKD